MGLDGLEATLNVEGVEKLVVGVAGLGVAGSSMRGEETVDAGGVKGGKRRKG